MKISQQRYNQLRDMDLINASKYDINARVSIIIQEVQDYLDQCEKRAREILGYETKENK